MFGYIDGYDFSEMDAMKYYAPPASWSAEKRTDTVKNRIFSGEWYAAEKKDGFFGKFVKDEDGNLILYSRSRSVQGNYVNKVEWVPHLKKFFNGLPNGTCLLGELYLPSQPGSKNVQTILGCLKDKAIDRQNKGEPIYFYIFDCLAFNNVSIKDHGFLERTGFVEEIRPYINVRYIELAEYYNGTRLWTKLQEILSNGGEGVVIIHQDAPYEPGKRPSKTTLKVKKELQDTIDCFFTGRAMAPTKQYTGKELATWPYWQHLLTNEFMEGLYDKDYFNGAPIIPVTKGYFYGWAGSLEIGVYDAQNQSIRPIGYLSGLTDEIKANYKDYAMKPIEVTAMEIDIDALTLRHGKFLRFRDDIEVKDCTWEKFAGHIN